MHQRFIQVQTNNLAYFCPQEFLFRVPLKITLELLIELATNLQWKTKLFQRLCAWTNKQSFYTGQFQEPTTRAFTHFKPKNLQADILRRLSARTFNQIFYIGKAKEHIPRVFTKVKLKNAQPKLFTSQA